MPKLIKFCLTKEQQKQLEQIRDTDKLPYMRERAAAMLKKAEGITKLTIKILQLPTYAPWANPIEKLWRWVRQSVLHLHRLSHDWLQLKQRIRDFIQSFRKGSNELLRYMGLLPD